MKKINNGFEFSNMEEYVSYFNLEGYIKYKTSGKKRYGHMFEEHVYKTIQSASDVFVRKTYADHDVLKGADLRFVFGETSVLVDIKLNKLSALKSNKYYLDEGLMLSKDRNDVFYFPLSKDLEVAFSLRDIRKADILNGYCKFKKPIIVATFNALDYSVPTHELFTEEAAREFVKYISILNINMIRENMPYKDVAGFTFKYNTEGEKSYVRKSNATSRRKGYCKEY